MRVIEAGEEVTVDYAAEQVPGLRLECNCGAPNCRGFIVGDDRRTVGFLPKTNCPRAGK
jgi:hypothetical protein